MVLIGTGCDEEIRKELPRRHQALFQVFAHPFHTQYMYITCAQFAFEGLVVGKFRVECTDLGPDSRLTLTNLYGHTWHMAVALILKQGRTCEDVDGRNCIDEPYCG